MRRTFKIMLMAIAVVLSTAAYQPPPELQSPTPTPQPANDWDSSAPEHWVTVGQLAHYGNSPVAPTDDDDSHFVTDSGEWLDRYLYRNDVPNGLLAFDIEITRYYSPLITSSSVDSNGFLLSSVRMELINMQLLPERATLTLQLWDVDHDASGCPEVDYVYINGQQVQDPGGTGPATLSSGNQTWSTWTISFPIEMLKFPTAKGSNGQPPTPKANEIAVEIDVQCGTSWAVEVDWGSIHIPSPIRPIVLAHGWTGGTSSLDALKGFLGRDGIPAADPVDLHRGIYPIAQTSPWLAAAINNATMEFGVDKVNIFAHSKGGLVSRHALRTAAVAQKTDHLITFSSPHHGTDWGIRLGQVSCRIQFSGEEENLCLESAREFSVDRIRDDFNYQGCTKGPWPWSDWQGCQPRYVQQPTVSYRSLVGTVGDIDTRTATYPWLADKAPYPDSANVDAEFSEGHSGIKESEGPYRCAVSYIDPDIYPRSRCPGQSVATNARESAVSATAVWPGDEYQTILHELGSLGTGETQTIWATLDGGTRALFNVLSSEPLGFTLVDPDGRTIDPSVAAGDPAIEYSAEQDSGFGAGWWYQYQVNSPVVGDWQNVIQASAPVDFGVLSMVGSTLRLYYKMDSYTYRPGDLVTLESALADATTPTLGATLAGTVMQPDGSGLTLSFYDDGTHGDTLAGDGVHTAQFNASSMNGHSTISLRATKGNVTRLLEAGIAVAAQSAQVQTVVGESPVDLNDNGLYDWLNMDVQINVLTSGQFEVSGYLRDNIGDIVASGTFATLLNGSGPLPVGLQTIVLPFDGKTIRAHGVDGPYTLERVVVRDQTDGDFEVDSVDLAYTTAAYQSREFEGALLSIIEGSEHTPDADVNGKYDELTISLNMEVIWPGNYEWNGRLVGMSGHEIGWATGSGYLGDVSPLELTFGGEVIGASKLDGPYTLRDLLIYQTSGGSASASFDVAYTTEEYSFTDFERGFSDIYLPLVMRSYSGSAGPTGPQVRYASHWIDDDTFGNSYGNDNGVANPGEFLEVYLELENSGDSPAYGVYVVPSTTDPYVNPYGVYFYDDNLWYGDMPAGTSSTGDDFDFMISSNAPSGHVITFHVDIYDSYGHHWTDDFAITVIGSDTTPPRISYADVYPKYAPVGMPTTINAFIEEGGNVSSAFAYVESPDETVLDTVTLYDDGAHNDGVAGDRSFAGAWIPTTEADFYVDFEATDDHANTGTADNLARFTSRLFTKTADILLVIDQQWDYAYEGYYEDALSANGFPYDLWNSFVRGSVDSSSLDHYVTGVVIYSLPDYGYLENSSTQSSLMSYLDSGGRLFITGQDIGYYLTEWGTVWNEFYSDYLHATYVQDDIGLYGLNGVSGDPIGDGYYLSISGGDGANNQYYPDEIDPIAPAVTIFSYDPAATVTAGLSSGDEEERVRHPLDDDADSSASAHAEGTSSSGTGAIRVDTGTYKVVYFSFGFEAINDLGGNSRAQTMVRVINWLSDRCTAPPIEDLSFAPASPSDVGTTVQIHAKATWDSCFRAMRLLIDGDVVYELGAPEFTWDWHTSGYAPGDQIIRLEVAAQGDSSWSNPSASQSTYHLASATPGIYGRVTENGGAASGVPLELWFWDGSSSSIVGGAITQTDGSYLFTGVPSLSSGQRYRVLYWNDYGTPGRLYGWSTWSINSYTAGSNLHAGDFDIADIALVSPLDGATVSLPRTFSWTPRPATPSDDYEFDLYDPNYSGPWWYTDPTLGYVGSYTLNSLPSGFDPNTAYWWEVFVYGPYGYGYSYEARAVTFSNTGAAAGESALPDRRVSPEDMQDFLRRR